MMKCSDNCSMKCLLATCELRDKQGACYHKCRASDTEKMEKLAQEGKVEKTPYGYIYRPPKTDKDFYGN